MKNTTNLVRVRSIVSSALHLIRELTPYLVSFVFTKDPKWNRKAHLRRSLIQWKGNIYGRGRNFFRIASASLYSPAFGAMRSRAFRIDSTGIVRTRKMQRKRSHFLRCTYIVAFSLPTSLCSLSKENIIRNAAVVVGECTIKCTCSIQS